MHVMKRGVSYLLECRVVVQVNANKFLDFRDPLITKHLKRRTWIKYGVWDNMRRIDTSVIICNNWLRQPDIALAKPGKFLTMVLKLSICATRLDAAFAVLVTRVSDAASCMTSLLSIYSHYDECFSLKKLTCRSRVCSDVSVHPWLP